MNIHKMLTTPSCAYFPQMNVHTASINDVVDRIFGKNGSWNKRKSVFDMLTEKRTHESMDQTKLELNKLKSKVFILLFFLNLFK